METAGTFRAFRDHLVIIIVAVILGVLVSAGVGRAITPTYTSQATLFLKVTSKSTSLYERSQFALQRVQSYPALLDSPSLLSEVIRTLNLPMTTQQLDANLSANNPLNTVLITVTANATTPKQSAAIANEAALVLAHDVDVLENGPTGSATSAVALVPQITAAVPSSPSAPKIPVIMGLGGLAGLVIGYLIATLVEAFRPRLRSLEDVRRATGLPLVAQIPLSALSRRSIGTITPTALSTAANIALLGRDAVPPVLLLTPVGRAARRSNVRFLVARGLTETGRRVLVAEGDRDAGTPSRFEVPSGAKGITGLLTGTTRAEAAVRPLPDAGFDILPAGPATAAPPAAEAAVRLERGLSGLAGNYDTVVLQATLGSSPLSLATVASAAQGALVVVSRRSTSAREVLALITSLRVLDIVPIGVVMLGAPLQRPADLAATWTEADYVTMGAEVRPARSQPTTGPIRTARTNPQSQRSLRR